jgi:hypothetical protein
MPLLLQRIYTNVLLKEKNVCTNITEKWKLHKQKAHE